MQEVYSSFIIHNSHSPLLLPHLPTAMAAFCPPNPKLRT
jgi:hypothetical protein